VLGKCFGVSGGGGGICLGFGYGGDFLCVCLCVRMRTCNGDSTFLCLFLFLRIGERSKGWLKGPITHKKGRSGSWATEYIIPSYAARVEIVLFLIAPFDL
jgi:hypothetical protein